MTIGRPETRYLTKWLFTRGIVKVEGWVGASNYFRFKDPRGRVGTVHETYAHKTRAAAVSHARKLQKLKIRSLRKQIEKIKKLKWED